MRAIVLLVMYVSMLIGTGFATANAQNMPKISTEVKASSLLVGQKNTIVVKILVPTWFTTPVYFEEVEAKNLLSLDVNKSAFPVSETIAGQTWSGIVKEYHVVALQPGKFALKLPTLKVHFMGENNTKITQTVDLQAISFNAIVPEKAQGLKPLIIADDIALEQSLSIPEELRAGATITRSLNVNVQGSSALFIPQLLTDSDTEFQRAYLRIPSVEDRYDARADILVGTRNEIQDTLLKTDGTLNIPAIEIRYYQPSSDSIVSVSVAGQQVAVKPGEFTMQQWLLRIAFLLLIVFALVLAAKRLLLSHKTYKQGEPYQFKQLIQAYNKPDKTLLHLLNQWRNRWRTRYLADQAASKEISDITLEIEQSVYGKQALNDDCLKRLHAHRNHLTGKESAAVKLRPLNP
jgi:disulfide bond formation protein DsbB